MHLASYYGIYTFIMFLFHFIVCMHGQLFVQILDHLFIACSLGVPQILHLLFTPQWLPFLCISRVQKYYDLVISFCLTSCCCNGNSCLHCSFQSGMQTPALAPNFTHGPDWLSFSSTCQIIEPSDSNKISKFMRLFRHNSRS